MQNLYGRFQAVNEVTGRLITWLSGGMIVVMLVMFLPGFVLDLIEITFVVVPIIGPVLLAMGLDPVGLCLVLPAR